MPVALDDAAGAQQTDPKSRIGHWQQQLLDLSLRNRLLNFKLGAKSTVVLLPAELASFEDALANGQGFKLRHRPAFEGVGKVEAPAHGNRHRAMLDALQGEIEQATAAKAILVDGTEAQTRKRLTELYRTARTTLEETGANQLYLCMGFLEWCEPNKPNVRHYSPLILLPAELQRGSVWEPFQLKLTDEQPRINRTLLKKLEGDFGFDVDRLSELPEDASGLDVTRILDRFRVAIQDVQGWEVLEIAAVGQLSFAKFLMWLDLDAQRQALLDSAVFNHLVEGSGEPYPLKSAVTKPQNLDKERRASDDLSVVDADSSQLSAVYSALDGNSFVLQGPPGTGKSQTITNLIAQLLGNGKTVLFVSEKMAALDVVHRRLKKVGLGAFTLELHSTKSKKAAVVKQFESCFEVAAVEETDWDSKAAKLQRLRNHLNRYAAALHEPGPWGVSVFQAAAKVAELDRRQVPVIRLQINDVDAVTRAEVDAWRTAVRELAGVSAEVGRMDTHPWRDSAIVDYGRQREEDITGLVAEASKSGVVLRETFEAAVGALGWLEPDAQTLETMTMADVDRLVETASLVRQAPRMPAALFAAGDWQRRRQRAAACAKAAIERQQSWQRLQESYEERVLTEAITGLAPRFERYAKVFFLWAVIMLFGVRRQVRAVSKGPLPDNSKIGHDLRLAERITALDQEVEERSSAAEAALGDWWDGSRTDWAAVREMLAQADTFQPALRRLPSALQDGVIAAVTTERHRAAADSKDGDKLLRFERAAQSYAAATARLDSAIQMRKEVRWSTAQASFASTLSRVEKFAEHMPRLRAWTAWNRALESSRTISNPLDPLIAAIKAGEVAQEQIEDAFERALANAWAVRGADLHAILRRFRGPDHDKKAAQFRNLDVEMQDLSQQVIAARLKANVPDLRAGGEVALLRGEFRKQRRHTPPRKLLAKISHVLPKLKPCLLMSPLSIAQYLDRTMPKFDVVVFDEASQIPPWDAAGALTRGKQVIVVGDSKQLPPTSFFQRGGSDEPVDEDDFEDLESILDEFIKAGFPTQSLDWHYRSRHEHLIGFSNFHYYGNRLFTFPGAAQDVAELGVKWVHVADGFYDRGKARDNRAEAQRVVDEIEARLTDPARSHKSIGVVTFSAAQQNTIQNLLEDLEQRRPELRALLSQTDGDEPLFVKNLENVQGDERDVMLFSICYAKDRAGKLTMAFGPLNRQGGERRLNVAVTRAKELLMVFSTLRPEEIDLRRTGATGAKHLKNFLEYAQDGPKALAQMLSLNPDADYDSPFEAEVAEALRERGWQIDLQVGCGGYRIDLAVRDPEAPGRYLAGIECDGATYHSSAVARDRDRIRQTVLEGLGWTIIRVWSPDWWHDRQAVTERVHDLLGQIQTGTSAEKKQIPANQPS